jgi:hypothetical protein
VTRQMDCALDYGPVEGLYAAWSTDMSDSRSADCSYHWFDITRGRSRSVRKVAPPHYAFN